MVETEIPADVRELVRETMNHYGNAQSNGANLIWNIYGVMRFAEACIVADRKAHPVNLTSERLNDVRAAIRTLPLAEAQPEFCVTDLVKRLPALEKKETYNALTYLASKGELERLGYGRYLIKGLLPPVTPKRTFEMEATPYRSPVEDAAYYASIWGLSNAKMQVLERAFTQHEVFGADHAARAPDPSREMLVEALRAQEHAESEHANCPDCDGLGDWAECGRCSEFFGDAIDVRHAALSAIEASHDRS